MITILMNKAEKCEQMKNKTPLTLSQVTSYDRNRLHVGALKVAPRWKWKANFAYVVSRDEAADMQLRGGSVLRGAVDWYAEAKLKGDSYAEESVKR